MMKRWEDQGYSLREHGILEEEVDAFVAAYANFTDNLPEPELATLDAMIVNPNELDDLERGNDVQATWHKYRSNHPFPFKPGGYTNRSLQAQALADQRGLLLNEDPKEYFHFLPSSEARVRAQHLEFSWGPLPPELVALYTPAMRIHRLGARMMRGVLAELEEYNPDISSKIVTDQDFLNSPIRLLFYHPGMGKMLAGKHTDKSIATAQLAESHVGYRARNPQTTEWQLLHRQPKDAIVFPSELLTLNHVYPDSTVIPTEHDVINMDVLNEGRTMHGQNVARWAIIFFLNSAYAGEIGKDKTHRGYQPLEVIRNFVKPDEPEDADEAVA